MKKILYRQFGLNDTFSQFLASTGLNLLTLILCTTLVIYSLSIPVSSQSGTIECGDVLKVFSISCFTACEISDQSSIFQESTFNKTLNGWLDYQSDASVSSLSAKLPDESCDCCAEEPANETTVVTYFQITPQKPIPQVLFRSKSFESVTVTDCKVQFTDRIYDKPDHLSSRATIVIIV